MMNGYFKPNRRKLAVATLVTACVFTAGWIRSLIAFDRINLLQNQQSLHEIESSLSKLSWTRITHPVQTDVLPYWSGPAFEFDAFTDCRTIRRTRRFGFDFGKAVHHETHMQYDRWAIPYWSIVIPLTILSAYLLLSKPRQLRTMPPASVEAP